MHLTVSGRVNTVCGGGMVVAESGCGECQPKKRLGEIGAW